MTVLRPRRTCPQEAPHEGIRRADAAMYLAKRAGKNRVVAA
jgi:PleD family two-component response regulator